MERNYSAKQLDNLRLRARQEATNAEHGIPKDQEGLSEEELNDIILELQRTLDVSPRRSIDDAYQRALIGIIYYAGYPERERYRKVLEPFLRDSHHAHDTMKILCKDWDLAAYYKQELREFIHGMPWDSRANNPVGYCQKMAVDCVSEMWSSLTDPTLLREVIDLYERIIGHSSPRHAGTLAYWSLRQLLGNPPITEAETLELAKELASRLEAAPEAELEKVNSAFISALQQERSVDQ